MFRAFLVVSAVLAAQGAGVGVGPGANWPQWRGPDMTGATTAKNLPVKWSTTENVTWKLAAAGLLRLDPIVWNDRVS